ncbi:MAG: transcriptional regulator [Candidatus Gracilibacteria bacterium]|nr:transcriptional regulator [Candidatus Gracilibacteria bacterium]
MDKTITFSKLKEELDLSDGNLGTHLEKLEKNGYIKIEKSFVDKKPRSTISIEKKGEDELISYINSIENMIKGIKK